MIDRRKFLLQSGAITTTLITPMPLFANSMLSVPGGSDTILKQLSLLNDKNVPKLLEQQIDNGGDHWDGGVANGYGIPNAHSTRSFISVLGSAYASPFSKYHLSADLEKPLERASACLVNVQYEDGTIDLYSTNFHSTPDTAFIVNDLAPIYKCLERLDQPGLKPCLANIGLFLSNAGKCLSVGGIHTPNHRWVVCAALAWLNSVDPSSKYVGRIDEWLSEGVDLDPDGQYTEKSVGVYSPTCDTMFVVMGRLLDRPELWEIARKNLNMSLYYIQPGGEVVTDASGRQDSAYTAYVNRYYYAYRYLAIKDRNPVFAAVCHLIEREMPEKITGFLPYLMEDPVFEQDLSSTGYIPIDYFKRFIHSGIFRIRRDQTDMTIIERNPTFFSYRKGKAVLQSLRLAAAFFGSRGQFISEDCVVDGEKIILSKSITHGYMQPIPQEEGEVIWNELSHAKREVTEAQTLNYQVVIEESKGKVSLDITVAGTDHVPVSMELSFRKGGSLNGVMTHEHLEDTYFLEKGSGTYTVDNDVLHFGPGNTAHTWAQMRGMLPKQQGNSVYITGYTPFRHTLVFH